MNLQKEMENEYILLKPLKQIHFRPLYEIASDPEIWKQHPNSDRFKMNVFKEFFDSAIESKGAFLIINKMNQEIIGSSRYYDYDEISNNICIGYTFYATKFWGTGINGQVKKLMLDYIFQFLETVNFHVGKTNFRSQKAMEKIGGKLLSEIDNENSTNLIYQIRKENWISTN